MVNKSNQTQCFTPPAINDPHPPQMALETKVDEPAQ
jgi:hypothetical protein